MAKKRKLDATVDIDAVTPEEDPARKGSMGGMWGGSAMNMLKQRIEDAHGSLLDGVKAGTVVVELDPAQIEDAIGSDRVTAWEHDADFKTLVANIERRGQTQPIRVRPKAPGWEPNPDNPLQIKGAFYIQSGRRRLEACRTLGRPVKAIIATEDADAALADLEERFHENTMRRNLNGFEELMSIGLLAMSLQQLTQTEIAERLGVAQGDVSLGLACMDFRKQILEYVDVENTPKRKYRSIIPKLKRGERLEPILPPAMTGRVPQRYDVRGIAMMTKPLEAGHAIHLKKVRISDEKLEPMLVDIAKVILKYQSK